MFEQRWWFLVERTFPWDVFPGRHLNLAWQETLNLFWREKCRFITDTGISTICDLKTRRHMFVSAGINGHTIQGHVFMSKDWHEGNKFFVMATEADVNVISNPISNPERERERQRDRQTEWEREKDRETDRQSERERERKQGERDYCQQDGPAWFQKPLGRQGDWQCGTIPCREIIYLEDQVPYWWQFHNFSIHAVLVISFGTTL